MSRESAIKALGAEEGDPVRHTTTPRVSATAVVVYAGVVTIAWAAILGAIFIQLPAAASLDGLAALVPEINNHPQLTLAMKELTFFGNDIPIAIAFLGVAMRLLSKRLPTWAWAAVAVGSGGLLFDNLIKPLVARPRPVFEQLVGGRGFGFPSGHVAATAALCVFLALYSSRTRGKAGSAWIVAATTILLMGVSRVYLGVHWPSDVIGGAVLGSGWAWLCVRKVVGPSIGRHAFTRRSMAAVASPTMSLRSPLPRATQ